jgi:hypothetical protein
MEPNWLNAREDRAWRAFIYANHQLVITADGTPVGNLPYATASFIIAALAVCSVNTATRNRRADVTHKQAVR